MDGKYLNDTGLKHLLSRLNKLFARYEEAKKYAGLELKLIPADGGVLNIGEELDENNGEWGIKQGKFYYSYDKITGIKFNQFHTIDDSIMGEAVIQFEIGDKDIIIGNDVLNALGWKWYQNGSNINNPVFKRNSLYMVHITTDHKVCFAELNTFEQLSIPDERCVEITYANSSNTVELFNLNWYRNSKENDGSINNIYFAADGENYSLIDPSLLLNNNKLNCSSINPKLLIEFNDVDGCNIDFTNMLHDINFDQFCVHELRANRIKSMKGMFSASDTKSTTNFTSIDLTGILNAENGFFAEGGDTATMFVNMFKNRRMNSDAKGENLKLFGNKCGINTSKATNLTGMFMNGPLQPSHCDQNNENNIIKGLQFNSCYDFTEMFRGLQCNNIILNALGSSNKTTYNFTGMFSNSSIDDSAISNISNFIKGISTACKTLNMGSIFEGCNNITDASDFSFNEIFNNKHALEKVYLNKMFSGCALLTNAPVLSLSHETHNNVTKLDLTSMFEDACKFTDNINFGNFKNWILNFTTPFEKGKDDPESIIIMDSMFKNCPLYKIKNSRGSVLEFCDKNKSKHISGHPDCLNMFAGTADPNGYKSYNIEFNIWAGLYWDHSDDNPENNGKARLDADWYERLNGMLDEHNKGFITIYNYNGLDEIGAPYNSILYYGLYNYIYNKSDIRTNIRLN